MTDNMTDNTTDGDRDKANPHQKYNPQLYVVGKCRKLCNLDKHKLILINLLVAVFRNVISVKW